MVYQVPSYLSFAFQVPPFQQATTDKALELAASFSQSLSQWAYIVLGGSVALLLRDWKYRPKGNYIRLSFLLFLPSWVFLGLSIYQGIRVQQRYVARWMNPNPQINEIVAKFNSHTLWQIRFMEIGLTCLAVWLTVFLLHWIFHHDRISLDAGLDEP